MEFRPAKSTYFPISEHKWPSAIDIFMMDLYQSELSSSSSLVFGQYVNHIVPYPVGRLILVIRQLFLIKMKKIKRVPKCGLGDVTYPMILIQMPICNERKVYQQSIAIVCNLDWPKDHMFVQILNDSNDVEVQLRITTIQKWQSKVGNKL